MCPMTENAKKKAPGKAERGGITLIEFLRMFPNDTAVDKWLVERRWPHKVACISCGSVNVQKGAKHKTLPFRCREKGCERKVNVRTGTVIEASKMGHHTWVFAICIVMASSRGVSSMNLHRNLGIGQKVAMFMLCRLRKAMDSGDFMFSGPVETDETYIGGLEANKYRDKKMKAVCGPVGKAIVASVLEHSTGRVAARVVPDTKAATLTGLVADHSEEGAEVFNDETRGYLLLAKMGYGHRSVSHSTGQWADDMAHTNGMENFWAMMQHGYHGTYHQKSHEHLGRNVAEFAHRHSERPKGTIEQMGCLARGMDNQRLTDEQLIAQGPHAKRRMEEMAA